MNTRSDEVRREIEQIRGDMGQTLEALGDRIAPGKVAARTKEKVADKVEDVRERVSPARVVKRQSRKLGDGFRSLMGIDEDDDPRRAVAGRANEMAGRANERANEMAGRALDTAHAAPQAVRAKAKSNPLALGLLTFAGGFLVASVLPPTDREQQMAERVREGLEPVVQDVVERGKAVAGELGHSAQESMEEIKRRAGDAAERVRREAAASAEELKSDARSAVADVKNEATDAVEQVKQKTQQASTTVADQATGNGGPGGSGVPGGPAGPGGSGGPGGLTGADRRTGRGPESPAPSHSPETPASGIRRSPRPRPLKAPGRP